MRAWLCLLLGHATAVQDNVGGDCYCERCSATLVRMAERLPDINDGFRSITPKSKPVLKKKK